MMVRAYGSKALKHSFNAHPVFLGTYLHSRHLQDMADFTSANEKVDRYNR